MQLGKPERQSRRYDLMNRSNSIYTVLLSATFCLMLGCDESTPVSLEDDQGLTGTWDWVESGGGGPVTLDRVGSTTTVLFTPDSLIVSFTTTPTWFMKHPIKLCMDLGGGEIRCS